METEMDSITFEIGDITITLSNGKAILCKTSGVGIGAEFIAVPLDRLQDVLTTARMLKK